MAHTVFISYASEDRSVAEAICTALESEGIGCWIAPRDITPGEEYAEAIVRALDESRIMVLVFSRAANKSPHIMREAERCVHDNLIIVPFILEKFKPDPGFEYYIRAAHWLDATSPPLDSHVKTLVRTIQSHLKRPSEPVVPSSERQEKAAPGRETPPPRMKRPSPRTIKISVSALAGAVLILLIAYLVLPSGVCDCTADFTFAPENPTAGDDVQFTDATTAIFEVACEEAGVDIETWNWDFESDGIVDSNEQNPVHAYAADGTHKVTLVVTLSNGQTCVVDHGITVSGDGVCDCTADYTFAPQNPAPGEAVQFTDLSALGRDCPAGTAIEWAWDFESEGSVDSNEQNPVYTYANNGTYSATLTITCDGSVSAITKDVPVGANNITTPSPPITTPPPNSRITLWADTFPTSISPGDTSEIQVTASTLGSGPLEGATITIRATAGTFESTGDSTAEGTTDSNGEFAAIWQAPEAKGGYEMDLEAVKDGYINGDFSTMVLVS